LDLSARTHRLTPEEASAVQLAEDKFS